MRVSSVEDLVEGEEQENEQSGDAEATSREEDSQSMSGALLESVEHNTRTLYCAPELEKLDTDGLIRLMETATDSYDCSGIILCLNKKDTLLKEFLHSILYYVGGSIIPPDEGALKVSDDILMVGLDL